MNLEAVKNIVGKIVESFWSNRVRSAQDLYRDKTLYSSPDMFSPPSERLPHVIRFELTKGCSWGRCTFCGGYDGVPFQSKTINEYKKHVDEVFGRIGRGSGLANSLKRIFIGGGNALSAGTDLLLSAIVYTSQQFLEFTGHIASRSALYGRTQDILWQGRGGLKWLNSVLSLIYWGVESGSSEVLEYVNKGCNEDDILKAAEITNAAGIDTSVMIMPGLGGINFYQAHVERTAAVLGKIRPKFITFMGINSNPNSLYAKKMLHEQETGKNRPLTNLELATQMIDIIERMPLFRTKVGCFDRKVDGVGFNPLSFGSNDIRSDWEKNDLAKYLKRRVTYHI